jgi:hypothetical protein
MPSNVIADPHDQQVTPSITAVSRRCQVRRIWLHFLAADRAIFPAIANHDVLVPAEVYFSAV